VNRGPLIVVSNRLPVVVRRPDDGPLVAEPASGGLVSALTPVLRQRGGAWIGWPGVTGAPDADVREALGTLEAEYDIDPIDISEEERQAFYHGFSNEIVWPLFHDLQTNCNFDPAYWDAYVRVNERFARAVASRVRRGDVVWVHDYHLILVGAELRRLGVENRIGFFLHIPFPSLDIFRKLPWRQPIAEAFLAYDLVGLQTARDRRNFVRSIQTLRSLEVVSRGGEGRGTVYRPTGSTRTTTVSVFPIGIDFAGEQEDAASEEADTALERFRRDLNGRTVVLGVDRLDYTKGIPQRLLAFREALIRHPELRGKTTLVQVVVPSREEIASYASLREEIERLVGQIDGELSEPGWIPVIYFHHPIERRELRGWYRAANVALITPLKDGMNLVSKEYCAARRDERGVLVLSEFAGAASQLSGALLVNPNDRVAVADAIAYACTMPATEQRARMQRMRAVVRDRDVFWWAEAFLGQLAKQRSDTVVRLAGT
jgi:trehalose 6-phosphate synthase